MIASISGIRGVYNRDLTPAEASRLAASFGAVNGSQEFLLARDTRTSGPPMSRAAAAGLLSLGATVHDCGVATTPAIFRESRTRKLPAIMLTASHNEPEFNGLKFIVEGAGVGKGVFDAVVTGPRRTPTEFAKSSLKQHRKLSYVDDLVTRFGARSAEGISVAADFGGGAAIGFAVPILTRMGCEVTSLNDSQGVFTRKVDPVADDLALLRDTVKKKGCDVGLGFDCDGDRLVIVDSDGKKRSGDFMLTLALSELLSQTAERKVVVSLDTTQAVDDVAERIGCQVFRSKVGEANVVGMMKEHGARLGGEGSSGGMIDRAFNYCRDSMLAALAIISAVKRQGRRFYGSVPAYHQARLALEIPKARAQKALKSLSSEYKDGVATDGLKILLQRGSWVLMRSSGTEDVVRVSAESTSSDKAERIARSFAKKLKELGR